MNEYPVLRNITMVMKHLLKMYSLNDPYTGGLSSYALILLIVAFMQYHLKEFGDIDFYEKNPNSLFITHII